MSITKILFQEATINKEYKYRVYKKSIDEYRVEKRRGGSSWEEIDTDKSIKKILMVDCRTFVDERGRELTLKNTGQDSAEVPVHAWIECNDYEIDANINNPDGTLYYNPYTVTQFVDRDSYENERPEIIEQVKMVSTDGNKLVYKGIIKSRRSDDVLDNNMNLLQQNENLSESCYL